MKGEKANGSKGGSSHELTFKRVAVPATKTKQNNLEA